jgi:hypothetical protein
MDDQATFQSLGRQERLAGLNPERVRYLTKVFDLVCEVYSIPVDALDEREALAVSMIIDSRSITHDGRLLEEARRAVESYRSRGRKSRLRLVPSPVSSHN